MKQLIQDCDCEDFPCCVHADNYAGVYAYEYTVPDHQADDGALFECESTCCECNNWHKCDTRECTDINQCKHQECIA